LKRRKAADTRRFPWLSAPVLFSHHRCHGRGDPSRGSRNGDARGQHQYGSPSHHPRCPGKRASFCHPGRRTYRRRGRHYRDHSVRNRDKGLPHASFDYFGVHSVQAAQLQHDQEQAHDPREAELQEVLQVLRSPHGTQGNQVALSSRGGRPGGTSSCKRAGSSGTGPPTAGLDRESAASGLKGL